MLITYYYENELTISRYYGLYYSDYIRRIRKTVKYHLNLYLINNKALAYYPFKNSQSYCVLVSARVNVLRCLPIVRISRNRSLLIRNLLGLLQKVPGYSAIDLRPMFINY